MKCHSKWMSQLRTQVARHRSFYQTLRCPTSLCYGRISFVVVVVVVVVLPSVLGSLLLLFSSLLSSLSPVVSLKLIWACSRLE
jgi:hypothetical protein